MSKNKQQIGIIGGGAAGMMVAATLIEEHLNADIHLFEKNPSLGVKVGISGGGRCNVTTGINEKDKLLKSYIRGSDFLKPALSYFSPKKVIDWFESKGVPLKTEKDNRVFPTSDHGEDVINVFYNTFKNKAFVHLNEGVLLVNMINETIFQVKTQKKDYEFDILVITSGGNAYAHTGSTGDGYNFAKSLNHTITDLGPSLNSFETTEPWCQTLSGISLEDCTLKTKQCKCTGPVLFTHFGISGPATFTLSAHLAFEEISPESPVKINLIPIASMNYDQWHEILMSTFIERGGKQINNILAEHLPKRFCEELLILCKIDSEKKCSEVSKEERKRLAHILSGALELTLIKRRKGDEFVTAGGVSTGEIDRKTMRSKINPNLYFAGEVLNIDGVTGGFNLQSAWSTGRLAGVSIAKELKA